VGMCSSVDILWLIILLASGWFLGMLTVVVHVTHLNCLHVSLLVEDCRLFPIVTGVALCVVRV